MNDPMWINADTGAPAYNAAELRRLQSMMLVQAVADRFGARGGVHPAGSAAVSLAGTTVTVLDTKAVVYPGLTSQSGPYIVQLPSEQHILDPADVTNPRKDIIVLRVYDDDEDLSGLREATSEYIAGTPAPSPAEPAVPTGAFRLATIDVPASGGGSATLTYNAPYTVAHGGILPVRNDAELLATAGGLYDGMARWRQDTDELQIHSGGSTWQTVASVAGYDNTVNPPACRVFRSTNQNAPNSSITVIGFDTERFDTDAMHSTSTNTGRITFNTAGIYLVGGNLTYESASDYIRYHIIIRKNGTTQIGIQTEIPGTLGSSRNISVHTVYKFDVGDYVELLANQQNSAAATRLVLNDNENSPEFWAVRLGSGV